MISDPGACGPRRKGEKRAQRIILNSLLWGNRTPTAAAGHPMRRSQESSGVILWSDFDGLWPFGLVCDREAYLLRFEQALEVLPLDS